jgi:hypothetical protein
VRSFRRRRLGQSVFEQLLQPLVLLLQLALLVLEAIEFSFAKSGWSTLFYSIKIFLGELKFLLQLLRFLGLLLRLDLKLRVLSFQAQQSRAKICHTVELASRQCISLIFKAPRNLLLLLLLPPPPLLLLLLPPPLLLLLLPPPLLLLPPPPLPAWRGRQQPPPTYAATGRQRQTLPIVTLSHSLTAAANRCR